jgi:hypothetical protein
LSLGVAMFAKQMKAPADDCQPFSFPRWSAGVGEASPAFSKRS